MSLNTTLTNFSQKLPTYDGKTYSKIDLMAMDTYGRMQHLVGVAFKKSIHGRNDIVVLTENDEVLSIGKFKMSVLTQIAKQI